MSRSNFTWGYGTRRVVPIISTRVTQWHTPITLISVRLVDGTGPHEGRVEIFYDGEWGTVCDDDFDEIDASTVCWQLGYTRGSARTDLEFGPGSGEIWLDQVGCDGLSPEIGQCSHNCWGCHDCYHHEDVGVTCCKWCINSLAPGRCGRNFKNVISEHMLRIMFKSTSCESVLV